MGATIIEHPKEMVMLALLNAIHIGIDKMHSTHPVFINWSNEFSKFRLYSISSSLNLTFSIALNPYKYGNSLQ